MNGNVKNLKRHIAQLNGNERELGYLFKDDYVVPIKFPYTLMYRKGIYQVAEIYSGNEYVLRQGDKKTFFQVPGNCLKHLKEPSEIAKYRIEDV